MRNTQFLPAALASALLVAPMLAHGQTPATPPGQSVTPGQPAPPTLGISPGMTPGGAVGQMPDRQPGLTQGQRGGTVTTTSPPMPGSPMTGSPMTGSPMSGSPMSGGTGQVAFAPGSAVMARPRMSQLIGAHVYNQDNNSIGSIDDVILVPPAGAGQAGRPSGPLAIVQVGGFLGLGGRLVSVPLADLQWNAANERVVLPGASRESLTERPEFSYDSLRTSR